MHYTISTLFWELFWLFQVPSYEDPGFVSKARYWKYKLHYIPSLSYIHDIMDTLVFVTYVLPTHISSHTRNTKYVSHKIIKIVLS